MSETILVINAGSSSIKFQLFDVGSDGQLERRLRGQVEGIGTHPHLSAKDGSGKTLADQTWPAAEVSDASTALEKLVVFLRSASGGAMPMAIGHRVVHGGPDYSEPVLVDQKVVERLQRFTSLAPLHQPNNLAPIRIILDRLPAIPQVACFDTAFHRGHPDLADRFAIPEQFYQEGVRRYGFHGLSYEYIAGQLNDVAPDIAKGRVVVAHLGSGASMCAIKAGKSVDSTMGFTALDGLPMGTRPGQIDAGVVLYLMSEKKMSVKQIEDLFYKDCGLKGLSGISNDVRDLLASEDPRAKLALRYFVYRIVGFAGMLAGAMGGIDALVFTAGIGENAPSIRASVVDDLAWLGLKLDRQANESGASRISDERSSIPCYVIKTDEELMIARHTLSCVRRQSMSRQEKSA